MKTSSPVMRLFRYERSPLGRGEEHSARPCLLSVLYHHMQVDWMRCRDCAGSRLTEARFEQARKDVRKTNCRDPGSGEPTVCRTAFLKFLTSEILEERARRENRIC